MGFVVNTHYHYDHVGNNHHLGKKGAIIIAHKNAHEHMKVDQFVTFFQSTMRALPEEGLPMVSLLDGMELSFNEDVIRFIHLPNAHTSGDIAAYFIERNVIVSGDIIRMAEYPFADHEHGGSIKGIIKALETLASLSDDKTVIVTGHGGIIHKSGLLRYKNNLSFIVQSVREKIDQGLTLNEIIGLKPAKEVESEFESDFMNSKQFITTVYNELVE